MMLANTYVGICEAFMYGHKAGIDLEQMIKICSGGGAKSFLFCN